jgi:RNA polymerase sigma-70 factor (ECF subfamily)
MGQDEADGLVRALRAGDPEAFDRVYSCWNRRLFAYLLRLSGRRELAEELLEETWLRVVKGVGGLRDETRLAPWLFAVARNLWLSHRRALLLEPARLSALPEADPADEATPSPLEAAAANELGARLERTLSGLPPAFREALLLVGVDGFAPREAARVVGVSPEAFRQRLARGRALLAARLREAVGVPSPSPERS